MKGNLNARMKRAMPSTYTVPEFTDEESIKAFAHELARLALTADVDPRRVDSAIRAANLALSACTAQAQAKLIDILAGIEHGGLAFAAFAGLRALPADGARRPLPWRAPLSTGESSS